MVQIYSYLNLKDRIVHLARVDRFFAYDKVRSGILCAHYGPNKLNWTMVLEEVERRVEILGKDIMIPHHRPHRQLRMMRNAAGGAATAPAGLRGGATVPTTTGTLFQSQIRNQVWLRKIERMKELAVFQQQDDLNKDRQNRMKQQQQQPGTNHWMVDLMTDREGTLRNMWTRRVNQLSDLVGVVDSIQHNNNHRHYDYPLGVITTQLDPGLTLHLPDLRPDPSSPSLLRLTTTEYEAETCIQCRRMTTDFSLHSCRHGRTEYMCTDCRQRFLTTLSPPTGDDDYQRRIMRTTTTIVAIPTMNTDRSASTTATTPSVVVSCCPACSREVPVTTTVIAPRTVRSLAVGQMPTKRRQETAGYILILFLILQIFFMIVILYF